MQWVDGIVWTVGVVTGVGITSGLSDPIFAVAACMAMVVMYVTLTLSLSVFHSFEDDGVVSRLRIRALER